MRPIDADALKSAFNTDVQNVMISWNTDLLQLLMIEIDEAPTLDVEPVRHGRWENYPGHIYRRCSLCKVEWEKPKFNIRANYCPNCGAKMDAKEE